jgi:hypothetical protein
VLRLNNLFIKFLRVYRKSLAEIIIIIITVYLMFEYFSQRFCCAEMIILTKSKKISKIIHILNAYKSIILLNAIDKIIKKIINNRIAAAAERYNLLL